MSWFAVLTSLVWIPLGMLFVLIGLVIVGFVIFGIGVLISLGFSKLFDR